LLHLVVLSTETAEFRWLLEDRRLDLQSAIEFGVDQHRVGQIRSMCKNFLDPIDAVNKKKNSIGHMRLITEGVCA
jgi:hypothetical protein